MSVCKICTNWNTPWSIRLVCSANDHWPAKAKAQILSAREAD